MRSKDQITSGLLLLTDTLVSVCIDNLWVLSLWSIVTESK